MVNVCSAVDCKKSSRTGDVRLHRFPTDRPRCLEWLKRCRRYDLISKEPQYVHSNHRLCSLHFDSMQFIPSTSNRLRPSALPTIFDTSTSDDAGCGVSTGLSPELVSRDTCASGPLPMEPSVTHLNNGCDGVTKRAAVSYVDSATQTVIEGFHDASTQTDDSDTASNPMSSQPMVSSCSQTDTLTMCDDPRDLSYEPSDSQASILLTSQSSESAVSPVDDRKFIVFETQLDKLIGLLVCPTCQCPCSTDDIVKKCNEGTLLHVVAYCTSGHVIIDWQSQPVIGRMPAGNLLLCASTLFSGQTFMHMQNIAELLNLKFMSHTSFYSMQCNNFIPVIMAAWKTHQQSLFDQMHSEGKPLRLCGDGRMDSPGFSAKYCTYSLVDMNTDHVVSFAVVDVTEAKGSSTNMEVLAFERCLQELFDNDFDVDVIATDRHVQVRSLLKRKYPQINHQFDVWHLAKSIRKKLQSVSHKKLNSDLSPWSQSICNHLWWCSANCNCDPDLLEESWSSIVHHIVNVHEFSGNTYTKCAHPPLTDEQQRRKKWVTPNSPAHSALKEVVLNKRLLKDIRQLNHFCHTGNLEVYHSLMTKYCPKRQEFDCAQMLARTTLCVLDHNNNTRRQQKVTSEGELCYKVEFRKASANWVAKPVYEQKTYEHVHQLMHSVVEQQEHRLLVPVDLNHSQNIAPVAAPSKQQLLSRHISRFVP